MKKEEQQPSTLESVRSGAYWLAFLAQVFAFCVEVLLRRRMGSRAVGVRGLAAFFLIPMWIVFFPGQDPVPLTWFWLLFVLGCLFQRVGSARGDLGHSRYSGEPILRRLLPWCSEVRIKSLVEPVLVMAVGLVVLAMNEPLGSFLIAAGIGLGSSAVLSEAVDRARIRDLNDARIEQEYLMARFREERGE